MSRILVIDDDPTVLKIIQRALQHQGHEVLVASNGREGLEMACQNQPALIICDWMMPYLDGLEVCRQVKANPHLSTTFFLLLTSRIGLDDRIEGLNTGADDFLSKPIEIAELQARVRAGLRLHQVSQDLQTQKEILEAELAEAAAYVRALLPPPMSGEVTVEARFIPSRQLGGDCFDYFWLDPDYLVMYLLDVSGHGLAAALPSILVLNLLRSQSLPNVNFYQPQDVLKGLNDTFQMSTQNEKYFTIWYGVYNRVKRQLTYASAGHPPAVLITPEQPSQQVQHLRTPSLPIGMLPDVAFTCERCTIPVHGTLYVFSDGVYELNPIGHHNWSLDDFIRLLTQLDPDLGPDAILQQVQENNAVGTFNDDVSLLKIQFA
ncbi:PP2C family protein-serine/threonine phosphatase [Leptolyngbya sp. 7M]|uniref:PP2C family protein-serine/threonine phosphatase n=1 Tax=Leptolyngbya sp. 7M TaxID=2812896 RepID=UPI001B8CC849|nr:SpoIIE family protein phosphatase [Leptolyngbya sp. 7M]QYO67106.1 SpoIIE family protein phosphatase [Leptolyngbya sp. 7M]